MKRYKVFDTGGTYTAATRTDADPAGWVAVGEIEAEDILAAQIQARRQWPLLAQRKVSLAFKEIKP
jgi:hypothetical protein